MEDRFMDKYIVESNECWIWTSAKQPVNYGIFWVGGKKKSDFAHRVSYMIHKGEIPNGKVIMHTCDNMLCVNPKHLIAGTQKENYDDSTKKGRSAVVKYSQKGSGNFAAKINEETASLIKKQKGNESIYSKYNRSGASNFLVISGNFAFGYLYIL
jgi:hypothetical protein